MSKSRDFILTISEGGLGQGKARHKIRVGSMWWDGSGLTKESIDAKDYKNENVLEKTVIELKKKYPRKKVSAVTWSVIKMKFVPSDL